MASPDRKRERSALAAAGAEAHPGSLQDLESLKCGAGRSDGVIHLAFSHDFSKFAENGADEQRAIEAIGAALEGSDRPLIVTSGIALLAPGGVVTERSPTRPAYESFPRNPEAAAAALRARGVRATACGFRRRSMAMAITASSRAVVSLAREKSVSPYVGDGLDRWPAVHRFDAARVFRIALERGAEGGPFHAVAEEGVPFKDIAGVIGRRLNVPVVSQSADEAERHFGWFGRFASIDCPASSERTRSLLGWKPEQPGLIADMDHPAYFAL